MGNGARTDLKIYISLALSTLYMNRTKNDQSKVHNGRTNRGLTTVSVAVMMGPPMMIPMLQYVINQLSSFPPGKGQ